MDYYVTDVITQWGFSVILKSALQEFLSTSQKDKIKCQSAFQVWDHLERMSRATATSKYTVSGLSAFSETVMSWVIRAIGGVTAMYQNSRSIVKKWYSTRQLMREREQIRKRIYLLYGSSEVGNTASLSHVKGAASSVKRLA